MTVELNKIYHGDALQVLRELPAEVVDCVVTLRLTMACGITE